MEAKYTCSICSNSFKTHNNLRSHYNLCAFKFGIKLDVAPDRTELYDLILLQQKRIHQLEEKLDELLNHKPKKHKKDAIIELNQQFPDSTEYSTFIEAITCKPEYLKDLINQKVSSVLTSFIRSHFNEFTDPIPLKVGCDEKIYYYTNQLWESFDNTKMEKFINRFRNNLYISWNKSRDSISPEIYNEKSTEILQLEINTNTHNPIYNLVVHLITEANNIK